MRNNILALVALMFTVMVHAQQDSLALPNPATLIDYDSKIFDSQGLQVRPEYPGGISAFYKFVGETMVVPQIESETDLSLKIYVAFIVEKDGTLSEIRAIRDPGYGLGDEAKRVLSLSKKWSPGVQNDKVVRASFLLPITINIEAMKVKKRKRG